MAAEMLQRLARDEDGAVLTEALLALLTVILITAAAIEFTFVVFQFNQANKALQVGSRLASISNPVDSGVLAAGSGGTLGGPPPTFSAITCTYSVQADSSDCDDLPAIRRIVRGGDGVCSRDFSGQSGMCDAFPTLAASGSVEITYDWAKLGYAGRPDGPVPVIRVAIRNVSFDLPVLGSILGLAGITMPAFTTTSVAEDMSSTAPHIIPE